MRYTISVDVGSQLRHPIFPIGHRLLATQNPIALVSKAAVHKDNFAQPRKDKIWRGRKIPPMQKVPTSQSVGKVTDNHLGLRVSPSDASHGHPNLACRLEVAHR